MTAISGCGAARRVSPSHVPARRQPGRRDLLAGAPRRRGLCELAAAVCVVSLLALVAASAFLRVSPRLRSYPAYLARLAAGSHLRLAAIRHDAEPCRRRGFGLASRRAFLVGRRAVLAIGLFLEVTGFARHGRRSLRMAIAPQPNRSVLRRAGLAKLGTHVAHPLGACGRRDPGDGRPPSRAARRRASERQSARASPARRHRRSEAQNAARGRADGQLRDTAGVDLLDLVGADRPPLRGPSPSHRHRGRPAPARSRGAAPATRDAVDDMTDSVSAAAAVLRRLFPSSLKAGRGRRSTLVGSSLRRAARSGRFAAWRSWCVEPAPPAQVDPSLMHGVLLNLVLNAHATPCPTAAP